MFIHECQIFRAGFFPAAFLAVLLILSTSCGQSLESHLTQGEEFLQKRRFQEAEMQFRAAADIDETLAAAHWGLARAHEAQGDFLETVQELKRVSELAPDNLDAKSKLGNYYLLFTPPQIQEAEKVLQDILKRDGKFIEGHILKASILSAQKKPENEVVAVLSHAISLDNKRTESYLALARYYMKIARQNEAEATIKTAIAANEKRALGYLELGRFLTYANRHEEAEAPFLKAIEVEPKDIESREAIASYYLGRRQVEKAEKAYQELVRIQENSAESRMDLANFYTLVDRDDDAIKVYQGILGEQTDYARARYKLAETYLKREEFDKVSAEIEKLLSVNDTDAEALLIRARLRLQENKTEEAIADLEEVLKKQPSLQNALFYMTQARLSLGQVDQARAFIGDLERFHPKYRRTSLLKIQAAFLADEPQMALQESNKLINSVSRSFATDANNAQELEDLRVRGITSRGFAHLRLGNIEEAEKDLTEVARLSPNSAGAKINLAQLYVAKSDIGKALELYQEALRIEPKSFDALSGTVSMLTRQKDFTGAAAKVDAAIKAAGQNKDLLPALLYIKSDIYTAQGNTAGAEAELKKAIELDAEYLPAYSAYASLLFAKNQSGAALEQYKKIVEKKPSASIYTLMGMIEDANGKFDAAEAHYRKALELSPGTAIAANNLAWMIADQNRGNLDEAMRLAQETADKNQNVAGFYDTLGWVNFKKGFHPRAIESFKKAVALDEADARRTGKAANAGYRLRLGMALAANGDKDSGKREVATALKSGADTLNNKEMKDARSVLQGS
ncbi:MAG: tetratricopeptide repeat protein [Pyrinomonadaceae bacterium]